MYLILLLILFGVLGYLLARSRAGDQIDDAAINVATKTSKWIGENLGLSTRPQTLRDWALKDPDLSLDTKSWIASLSDEDCEAFEMALENHARNLNLDLPLLFSGKLDTVPEQKKVYVEAVSIYSQAYRKAKEIQQDEDDTPEKSEEVLEGDVIEGKSVAEKRPSRRKSESPA